MTPAPAHDEQFACLGTTVRVVVGTPLDAAAVPPASEAAAAARRQLLAFDERLSRFRPDSELSRLNAGTRHAVPASPLLCEAVAAALWAAERTGGLVDPTLLDALAESGYASSRAGARSLPLDPVLAGAPARRPAEADPRLRWRQVRVDRDAGLVRRPPGLHLDLGGTGKGLAADLAAARLTGYDRFVVDCGGDLRLGGRGATEDPFEVQAVHPRTGRCAQVLHVSAGGVATSGIDRRAWPAPDGGHAHHLLAPGTGAPAWTGLVGATALAPTALEADALAKAAVLSGPAGARRLLRRHGGLLFHDDGRTERVVVPIPPAALRGFTKVTA